MLQYPIVGEHTSETRPRYVARGSGTVYVVHPHHRKMDAPQRNPNT